MRKLGTQDDDPISRIDWPRNPTVRSLGHTIGQACGVEVVVEPIPAELQTPEVSGLTVIVSSTARVYYENSLSALNRLQTVLHEYAHILHGDVRSDGESTHAARTIFDNPIEHRAELTGLRLMTELRRRQHHFELLDFISGTPEINE